MLRGLFFWPVMVTVREAAERAKQASYRLASLPLKTRNGALESIAIALRERSPAIEEANVRDLQAAKAQGLPQALVKRLRYDRAKIEESVESIRSLMAQEDVVGKLLSRTELDEGLVLDKVSCPIGVIGVVFESRPDALVQISCLCLRSGNAVLLKGGTEAKETNLALAGAIEHGLPGGEPVSDPVLPQGPADGAAVRALCCNRLPVLAGYADPVPVGGCPAVLGHRGDGGRDILPGGQPLTYRYSTIS